MQPFYFDALQPIEELKPVLFDKDLKLRRERPADLCINRGFPIIAQARISPEQTMYEQGTNVPWATWTYPSHSAEESGCDQSRDAFWFSWMAEKSAEVWFLFGVWEEGENLD
jgi:hypothetical protein